MILSRVQIAIMTAVLAVGAGLMLAPQRAQSQATPPSVPCRIVWDEETSGGDTQTTHAEMQLTRSAPQADGSFMMFGSGRATITYHSANRCRITGGSPFTATISVMLTSMNGRTADVEIYSLDGSSPVDMVCALGAGFTADVDVSEPPTVTVPLQDGARVPYSTGGGAGIYRHATAGTVTLQYCSN
jgi:hypothetical protein